MTILGFDIGGTTCTVVRASDDGRLMARADCPTGAPAATLARLIGLAGELGNEGEPVIGIACGGPLDVAGGRILSPPNLPGWDDVPVVAQLESALGGRAFLMNDASAGALAEWRFGAGQGLRHLAFLTFGTGIGAGLVFDGRLYEGAGDLAGEIGHIRLSETGPTGHGKAGSIEGWCSGGGLQRQLADLIAAGELDLAKPDPALLASAAAAGDPAALAVFERLGRHLGRAVALLVDLLALEAVILGSLYWRARSWIEPALQDELQREALPGSLARCRVVPAALGEDLGAWQAIAVALSVGGGLVPAPNDPRLVADGGQE